MKNVCRICGVKFETKYHNRKVCKICVDKIYPKIKTMKKSETCLICGKPIENTGKRERKYCSRKCSDIGLTIISIRKNEENKRRKSRKISAKQLKKIREKRMDMLEMAARKSGMDYGTYTAMLRMNR